MDKKDAQAAAGSYHTTTKSNVYCPTCKEEMGLGIGTKAQFSLWRSGTFLTSAGVKQLRVFGREDYWKTRDDGEVDEEVDEEVVEQVKINDDDDCMEEIQNIQKQLKDLSEGTGVAAARLTRRIANIESNVEQINETLQHILSSQLYLVKKLKRNRVVPKSMGDSDIFENDEPWVFGEAACSSVIAPHSATLSLEVPG